MSEHSRSSYVQAQSGLISAVLNRVPERHRLDSAIRLLELYYLRRSHFSISPTGGCPVVGYEIRFGDRVSVSEAVATKERQRGVTLPLLLSADRWRGNDCQFVINDFDIALFDALGDFWMNGELRLKKLPEHRRRNYR